MAINFILGNQFVFKPIGLKRYNTDVKKRLEEANRYDRLIYINQLRSLLNKSVKTDSEYLLSLKIYPLPLNIGELY